MMSISRLKEEPPQPGQRVPGGSTESASGVYQESTPFSATIFTTARLTSGEFSALPQPEHRNTAIGTPQTRWREMHQSGRVAIMLEMRSSPQAGSQRTFLISSSDRCRSVLSPTFASMEMNHCSVARKMTGLWQRQQCG